MTKGRKAARDAAKEVIEQTEVNIRDLRTSLRERVWGAANEYASETPWIYRDMKLQKQCNDIAREVVDELLGGEE